MIGTPINQYYPKENKDLQIQIEKNGLIVSQFPACNPINRWNFPSRNGVMSGLSLATIIMDAKYLAEDLIENEPELFISDEKND